jgi:hypothetical protein
MAPGEFYKLDFQQHFIFLYISSPREEKKASCKFCAEERCFSMQALAALDFSPHVYIARLWIFKHSAYQYS